MRCVMKAMSSLPLSHLLRVVEVSSVESATAAGVEEVRRACRRCILRPLRPRGIIVGSENASMPFLGVGVPVSASAESRNTMLSSSSTALSKLFLAF